MNPRPVSGSIADDVLMPCAQSDEAIRATRLWLERAVIGLNLCPFAKAVHRKGQIRYAVTAAVTPDELLAELERELRLLAQCDPALVETTLLVHPHAMTNFLDYHFFLDEANALLRRLELAGVLQVASFHPKYEFAGSAPDDRANYTNRSPHPMLHLLREASIDRAVAAYPNSSEITDRNIQNLRSLDDRSWRLIWNRDVTPEK